MGLNRFYTYNGQILKTAEGNPIGYEYFPDPPATPTARYQFEDNLIDTQGNYNLSTEGSISYDTGIRGKGIVFPGTAANQLLTSSFNANTFTYNGNWTVAGWLKLTTSSATKYLIMVGGNSYLYVYTHAATPGKLKLYAFQQQCDLTVNTDEWLFFAMTGEGGTLKGYLNDGDAQAFSGTANNVSISGNLSIGCAYSAAEYAYAGMMDQLYFYNNKALSAAELSTLYNSGNGI